MRILKKKKQIVNDNNVLDVYYLSEITARTSNLKNTVHVRTHRLSN
jgi:hypothetical protein